MFSDISKFEFSQSCSFSVPSWLEKVKQPSWLEKSEHLFLKNLNVHKPFFFLVVWHCNIVYFDFTTF